VLGGAAPAVPVVTETGESGYVVCSYTDEVIVLSGPSQPPIVTTVKCGDKIYLLEEEREQFRKVRTLDGKVGYVRGTFLSTRPMEHDAPVPEIAAPPQTARPLVESKVSVGGRISAITSIGDVKPARHATVYLFYDPDDTVAREFTDVYAKYLEQARKSFPALARTDEVPILACQQAMVSMYSKHAATAIKVEADIDGEFDLNLAPGTYRLTATGRAGANDAVWLLTINVPPGKVSHFEIDKPAYSYLLP
jgi:hypothetical protein